MKLQEIYDQLTHGELSQIHLGGDEQGEINQNNYLKMMSHVNLALTALHKRFLIREDRVRVHLHEGMFTYPLTRNFAESNRASREPIKTIRDTRENPFTENILKIERVLTASGHELGLNDENSSIAIQTPMMNTLLVPEEIITPRSDTPAYLRTPYLDVVYRANHPILTEDNGADFPEDYEVELPYSYLEPLLYYIASRIHNPIGMANEFHAGNSWAAKYEQACQRLEQINLRVDPMAHVDRIQRGGWV